MSSTHAKKVLLLKSFLLGGVFLLVLLIVIPVVIPDNNEERVIISKDESSQSNNLNKMINPSFNGITESGLPFNIKAKEAEQIDEQKVRIFDITGGITLEDGSKVSFSADNGEINIKNNKLVLKDKVKIISDNGYELNTSQVFADMEKELIYGTERVTGTSPMGRIDALGFNYRISDRVLKFDEDIKVEVERE